MKPEPGLNIAAVFGQKFLNAFDMLYAVGNINAKNDMLSFAAICFLSYCVFTRAALSTGGRKKQIAERQGEVWLLRG